MLNQNRGRWLANGLIVLWSTICATYLYGGEPAGVGIALVSEGDAITVGTILPDTPAAASKSLNVGDRILAVGQQEEPPVATKGLKLPDVVKLMRGERGTTVRLTVVSTGQDASHARVVSLVRGDVKALEFFGDGHLMPAGAKAVNIDITRLGDRQTQKLAGFQGKIVIVEFWARWCGPCQKIMAELQEYPARYPQWRDKVVLIAASVDEDQDATIEYLKSKGWDQTHNVSVGSEALKAYHVGSLPTTYIIDQRGGIAAAGNQLDIAAIVNRLLESNDFIAEFRALEIACDEQLEPMGQRRQAALKAAKTKPERDKINDTFFVEVRAMLDSAAQQAFAVVQPHAAEPVSVGPLLWILQRSGPNTEISRAASDLLVKYHLTNQQVLDCARAERDSGKKWVESLLRAQVAADKLPEDQRPKQMLALAFCLGRSAELNPIRADQLEGEAVRLFTEVGEKYPNIELAPGMTIAAMAQGGIFAIKNLGIGKTAPDIQGEDLEGVAFKLSDYRGKVVMISFWATWCGPCMALVPHERELLVRYQGKPFAIVGVNGDKDREQLKPLLAKHEITWQSFWCGEKGPFGIIPTTWSVQSWPTVYLVDHAGVIRAKDVLGTALDSKIEELVTEAEKAMTKN